MNKLLSVVIVILLVVVGYLWTQKGTTDKPELQNEALSATDVNQEVPEDTIIEVTEPALVAATTGEAVATNFCADLKAGIPGSAGFHITIDVASGELIKDASTIKGCVYAIDGSYGTWGPFEGQVATYKLLASDGTILDEGFFQTMDSDWLTLALAGDDIAYETTISFDPLTYVSGTLVVQNENPSGEAGLESNFTVPVTF